MTCTSNYANYFAQVILITDGNTGVGEGSLKMSLQKYNEKSLIDKSEEETFPLPYVFPCKLNIMCMCPATDKLLETSLRHYERLLEINKYGGQVYVPDSILTHQSVETMFKSMANDYFTPFLSTLKCGNLTCPVQMFPAPDVYRE